jgi:hypothetical protein
MPQLSGPTPTNNQEPGQDIPVRPIFNPRAHAAKMAGVAEQHRIAREIYRNLPVQAQTIAEAVFAAKSQNDKWKAFGSGTGNLDLDRILLVHIENTSERSGKPR